LCGSCILAPRYSGDSVPSLVPFLGFTWKR